MYRPVLIIFAIAAVAATAAGCQTPPASAPATPAPTTSAPAAGAAGGGPASPSPEPTAARPAGRCRAADLSVTSITNGAAMGTAGHEITVTNTSRRPCALIGDEVVIVYRDSTGKTAVLPTKPNGDAVPTSRIVSPGRHARATLLTVNGYGGYDPSSPACAHPAVYRNLSLKFRDGGLLALKGLTLDVKCGDIRVSRWSS